MKKLYFSPLGTLLFGMEMNSQKANDVLLRYLIETISETNGISLADTLELMAESSLKKENK
jgi:hypothetical protein